MSILAFRNGSIGNTLAAVPALRALHMRYPEARLSVVVDPVGQQLLEHCPWIARLIVYDKHGRDGGFGGWWRVVRELRSVAPTHAVLFKRFFRNGLLARLSGAPIRAGFNTAGRAPFLNRTQPYDETAPVVDLNLRLAALLGAPPAGRELEVFLTDADRQYAREILSQHSLEPKHYLVAHYGGLTTAPDYLPVERFALLLRALNVQDEPVLLYRSWPQRSRQRRRDCPALSASHSPQRTAAPYHRRADGNCAPVPRLQLRSRAHRRRRRLARVHSSSSRCPRAGRNPQAGARRRNSLTRCCRRRWMTKPPGPVSWQHSRPRRHLFAATFFSPAWILDIVSIIIPNFNGAHYLSACLSSLVAQNIAAHRLEIVLIDNASTDASVAIIEQQFPAARIIRNAQNVGFTSAVNQGIEAARGAYILLLNNDTELQPDALHVLLEALESGPPELGGVQPLLLRASDPALVDSAGIALEPRFRARDDLHGAPRALAPASPTEIWGLCAGCALIRRSVFDVCGVFDPDYFAEWDDVDFSLRARWCGFHFLLVPAATVLHYPLADLQSPPRGQARPPSP